MEIKKIIYKKSVLSITYEDNGSTFSLKTEDDPREAMLDCFTKLRNTLLRALGISLPCDTDKDYEKDSFMAPKIRAAKLEREAVWKLFSAIGISYSYSDKTGSQYRIYGSIAGNTIKTPSMGIPAGGKDYWQGKDPRDFPTELTPEDKETIDRLMQETAAFLDGAREQPGLFDEQEEETEEES